MWPDQNLLIFYSHDVNNCNKAFELAKKLADEGIPNVINELGYCYKEGIGTDIDEQIVFELYQEAANLGNDFAQYNLALMYENGDGTEKNGFSNLLVQKSFNELLKK